MNMEVNFCGIKMKNPIIAASGTFGYGVEYKEYLDLNKIGAISVKGLGIVPWNGNEGVRIAETASGMLNCIGLENPGVEKFLSHYLPELKSYDVPIIANMVGKTAEEYGQVAKALTVPGVSAIEVNISCPNVTNGGIAFGTDPKEAAKVTREVKRNTTLPVIVKLSPNVTDIVSVAKAVEEAGADAISLINTLMGMAIDIETRRPKLSIATGGLSGPAVKPVALRMVWQVARAVKIPVIGLGGIMTAQDVVEFLMAGATAVQIGTANFIDPAITMKIAANLEAWMDNHNLKQVQEIIGSLEV